MCSQSLTHVWFFVTPWESTHSDSIRIHCPWDFPNRNTGVGYHFLLQGSFPDQGSNPCLLHFLHWKVDSLPLHHLRSDCVISLGYCVNLLKNFPWFVVTLTVKFWPSQLSRNICFSGTLLLFLMIQKMLAIWSLLPLPFLNSVWTFGSSRFTYCWSLAWRILSITLLVCEMSATVQ